MARSSLPRRSWAAHTAGSMAFGALAVAYLATAWWIVFSQRWGRVVAVIDASSGRGVHAGDVVGLGCLAFGVAMAAMAVAVVARLQGARVAHGRRW